MNHNAWNSLGNTICETWALFFVVTAVLLCSPTAQSGAEARRAGDDLVARAKGMNFPFGSPSDSQAVKQHYETKIALLEAAISQNARHYDAHVALAKTYFQSVIMDGAYKGKLTSRNLNEQERMAIAFRVLDRAIDIDPARAEAFALRAGVVSLYAAFGFENFKQKFAGVQRLATSRGSQQPAILAWLRTAAAMDLAWARCHALRALPDLKRVLKLKPADSDAWFDYGRTLMILKREAEARAAFGRALALAPNVSSYSLADTALQRLQSHKRAGWYHAFAAWSKGPISRRCLSGWRWPPWVKMPRDGKPASYGYPEPPKRSR